MHHTVPAPTRGRLRRPEPAPPPLDPDSARVLDAAVRLFWRHGYRQTTTRDIETLAGISLARIYCLFGSKERLLAAALLRYADLLRRELLAPLEESELGLEAIESFFDRLGHWVTHEGRPGCMLVNILAETDPAGGTVAGCLQCAGGRDSEGPGDESARDRAARCTHNLGRHLQQALQSALERAAARGELAPGSIPGRARLLATAVLGLNLAARGGASDPELGRMLAGIHSQIQAWRRH